jgi:hypothetical protein
LLVEDVLFEVRDGLTMFFVERIKLCTFRVFFCFISTEEYAPCGSQVPP